MSHLIPLTEEERIHLQTIYTARFRVFCGAYSALVFIGLVRIWGPYSIPAAEHPSKRLGKGGDYEIFGRQLTSLELFYLLVFFFGGLILISGIVIFLRRVHPFKKDVNKGMKEVVHYTIIRKSEFPLTGQFFFSFNDPRFMHYEVDEATYHSFSEGDSVGVYRGVHSKYVFVKDGRFTFM